MRRRGLFNALFCLLLCPHLCLPPPPILPSKFHFRTPKIPQDPNWKTLARLVASPDRTKNQIQSADKKGDIDVRRSPFAPRSSLVCCSGLSLVPTTEATFVRYSVDGITMAWPEEVRDVVSQYSATGIRSCHAVSILSAAANRIVCLRLYRRRGWSENHLDASHLRPNPRARLCSHLRRFVYQQ